jgi:hypothetical protein
MRWLVFSSAFVFAAAVGAVATADPTAPVLVTRLVEASNELAESDPHLKGLYASLKKVFGYDRYRQLAHRATRLKPGQPVTIDLGKDFQLVATYREKQKHRHHVVVAWRSGKTLISRQTIKSPANKSIFIKGPEVGKTWIILALTVRE